ncbi:MAG: anaerobic ribonucleoside-triphosphate reductase activating protein [Clostridia bacterium]|nr:anaerobic ribonucleoside-triphosphate reductase activating protein [Clostridia bacterium]
MNYAEIKYCDIANGEGVRTSLFVSGCTHHCKNCFNKIAWDFNYGKEFTESVEDDILKSCEPDYISGVTLLGGEPFEPENQPRLLEFLKKFKEMYPEKNVWCYSGYTYEELTGKKESRCFTEKTVDMLNLIDILVDGEYVEELHTLMIRFRGSTNQRLIDLNATRKQGEIVTLKDRI